MSDFPFDHDSGKAMNRHRSNAKAEAGLEHRKLREEIEALKHDNGRLLESLNQAESELERLRLRVAMLEGELEIACDELPQEMAERADAALNDFPKHQT